MTADEIRQSESNESELGQERAYWLREIAAQLADLNQTLSGLSWKIAGPRGLEESQ